MSKKHELKPTERSTSRFDASRRRLVASTTAAAATIATGDALAQAARCVLTDNAGEGPFYFDPDLIRSDVTDDMPGAPLSMAMQITRASDCAALGGARVDVWQANAIGLYSGYENQPGVGGVPTETAVGQTWLRGTQLTDADGWVRFSTIYPSWYGGRTPHLHFKVWLGPDEVVASQVFFPDETSAYVFEQFEPYRSHIGKRTTFNDNDPLQQGVYCETERSGDGGISASTVISVAVA